MIILNLNPYELMTLSSHSKIKVAKNSPLTGAYLQNLFDFNNFEFQKTYKSFLENHFLVRSGEAVALAKEFEPLFLMLHQPEVSVSFKRLSDTRINEVCFGLRSEFVTQIVTNSKRTLNVITYPIVIPAVGTWIQNELMAGFEFEANSIGEYETTLDLNELLVLSVILYFMKERVIAKGERLTPEECFIEYEQIREFKEIDRLNNVVIQLTGNAVFKEYLLQSDSIDTAITSLYQKGLLSTQEQFISLSGFGKRLFNPGKIKDSIYATERLPLSSQTVTINIMEDGYMLLRTEDKTDDIVCHLHSLPTDTSHEMLFKCVCPSFFKDGFGDIEKYKLNLERESVLLQDRLINLDRESQTNNIDSESESVSNSTVRSNFCTQCGSPVVESSKFCIQCGNRLQ